MSSNGTCLNELRIFSVCRHNPAAGAGGRGLPRRNPEDKPVAGRHHRRRSGHAAGE